MSKSEDKTRFNTSAKPNWCPGCGNFGIHTALKKALLKLELEPHQVILTSGIGCSSKIPHWANVYGLHGLHGRTLPLAAGIKLANSDLTVIAEGGDGDAFSEGMGHFVHACRRNINFTYIVHNNGVFALTTGQTSTTGKQGFISSSTPSGSIEMPFSPAALAIASGATFVAVGYSGDTMQLSDMIAKGIEHRGFSLINIMQICVSFNPKRNYKWYKERIYKLESENHESTDREKALNVALALNEDRLPTGVFYQRKQAVYEDSLPQIKELPLVKHDIGSIGIDGLMADFV
ncbi:MAG: 2-oxoacid ferredoxin oxidoreductase [candidate division Zixibacteria bacterium]|nr:2-oxoacid ferredoxin oxidoreductase [candidate division Zixibacteria bacterium]